MSKQLLDTMLDELVPTCDDARGDWRDVLDRAGTTRSERGRRRRPLILAVAILGACALAAPALAYLLGLIGRTDVPFNGQHAPYVVRKQFYDLSLHPAGVSGMPRPIPAQAREVGVFKLNGRSHVLWVAPASGGSFCWTFAHLFGGCRDRAQPLPTQPGSLNPGLIGVTMLGHPAGMSCPCPSSALTGAELVPSALSGAILSDRAERLEAEYENGKTQIIPFVYVSKPINAGFYLWGVPPGHAGAKTRVRALLLFDGRGKLLARRLMPYDEPRVRPRPAPRVIPHPVVQVPSAPITHASADGVTVDIGRNGVLVFHLDHLAAARASRLAGRAGFGCFKFMLYHEGAPYEAVDLLGAAGTVTVPNLGIGPPFDGCEIQAGYGRVWPDPFHSHAIVEIALTKRGADFFANRAAARDLALFLNSKTMRADRSLTGAALATAIRKRYGSTISELPSANEKLAAGRIGFVSAHGSTTYVEYSTTGRRFYVVVKGGRVASTDVRPLAMVLP